MQAPRRRDRRGPSNRRGPAGGTVAAIAGMAILLYVVLAAAYGWAVVDLARQARGKPGPGETPQRGELVVLRRAERRATRMARPAS